MRGTYCLCNNLTSTITFGCPLNSVIKLRDVFMFDNNLAIQNQYCPEPRPNASNIELEDDDFLKDLCNYNNSCVVPKYAFKVDPQYGNSFKCLSARIDWSCYSQTTSSPDTISINWSFTYFFYLITLILSTSCIVIGALFVIRRILLFKQIHASRHSSRRLQRGQQQSNENGVWTISSSFSSSNQTNQESYPPAYDNIYEQSTPINPPPDYYFVQNNKKELERNDPTTIITNESNSITNNTTQPNNTDNTQENSSNGQINRAYLEEDPANIDKANTSATSIKA